MQQFEHIAVDNKIARRILEILAQECKGPEEACCTLVVVFNMLRNTQGPTITNEELTHIFKTALESLRSGALQ